MQPRLPLQEASGSAAGERGSREMLLLACQETPAPLGSPSGWRGVVVLGASLGLSPDLPERV